MIDNRNDDNKNDEAKDENKNDKAKAEKKNDDNVLNMDIDADDDDNSDNDSVHSSGSAYWEIKRKKEMNKKDEMTRLMAADIAEQQDKESHDEELGKQRAIDAVAQYIKKDAVKVDENKENKEPPKKEPVNLCSSEEDNGPKLRLYECFYILMILYINVSVSVH